MSEPTAAPAATTTAVKGPCSCCSCATERTCLGTQACRQIGKFVCTHQWHLGGTEGCNTAHSFGTLARALLIACGEEGSKQRDAKGKHRNAWVATRRVQGSVGT